MQYIDTKDLCRTMKLWCSSVLGFLGVLVLLGCGDSPTSPETPFQRLPARFQIVGAAASNEPDGSTVTCELALFFELSGAPSQIAGALEYRGIHGGSVRRTVLDAFGDGISLWPDVFGEVVVRSTASRSIEILIPANVNAEGRFWQELARFDGLFAPDGSATGEWKCAPFDIDSGGWIDTQYTANGIWDLSF